MGACCAKDSDAKVVESTGEPALAVVVPSVPPNKEPEPVAAPVPEPEKAPAPATAPAAEDAPPAAAPAAVTGPSLTIEFDKKTVNFTEGPLGITFLQGTVPLVVTAVIFEGVGDKGGVEKGMVFKKIAGETLEGKSFEETMTLLKTACDPLKKNPPVVFPPDAVVIEFIDDLGKARRIPFEKKPLGMSFDSTVPIKVKTVAPGGVADSVGVQAGWMFKAVTHKSMSPPTMVLMGQKFPALHEILKNVTKDLPEA